MKSKDQENVVRELKAHGLSIASVHLLKFGTICISTSDSEDSQFGYSDRAGMETRFENDDGLIICKSLAEAMESHPNVFAFESLHAGFALIEHISMGHRLLTGPIYRASVHLPKKQQKYQDMDCEEHFSVYLSGTYFAAVAKVEGLSAFSNMAHEFREIFRSQVLKKTKFSSPILGPCPTHPDFFIVGVRVEPNLNAPVLPQFYTVGPDLYVVVNESKVDDTIEDVFWDCLRNLSGYYELALSRLELIHLDSEVQSRMSILVEAHSGFASLPVWKFRTIQRHLTAAREQLANIYQLRVEHSKGVMSYKRSRKHFLDSLKAADSIFELGAEFKNDTILDVDLPDSLLPSIQFFQAQADAKRGAYSLFVATLIGALLGGFITLAATLLHTQK